MSAIDPDAIDYDGRLFRVASTSEAGEAGEETLFRYRQRGADVWATYEGGAVRMGTLVGTADADGRLDFRYAHVGADGALRSGACRSTPERLPDGRLRLHERWRWTGGEAGTSVVEEVAPLPADAAEVEGVLEVLRRAERLKDTLRSAHTSGGRRESVAEHTWRLGLMALLLHDRAPGVDPARLLGICLVHDLGEAVGGDVPAPEQEPDDGRAARERADLADLVAALPPHLRDRVLGLYDEYEAAATPEARLAKALDKLETLLQHTQGRNPPGFDYAFNLDYGRRHTTGNPTVEALRRLIDAETGRLARGGS